MALGVKTPAEKCGIEAKGKQIALKAIFNIFLQFYRKSDLIPQFFLYNQGYLSSH